MNTNWTFLIKIKANNSSVFVVECIWNIGAQLFLDCSCHLVAVDASIKYCPIHPSMLIHGQWKVTIRTRMMQIGSQVTRSCSTIFRHHISNDPDLWWNWNGFGLFDGSISITSKHSENPCSLWLAKLVNQNSLVWINTRLARSWVNVHLINFNLGCSHLSSN